MGWGPYCPKPQRQYNFSSSYCLFSKSTQPKTRCEKRRSSSNKTVVSGVPTVSVSVGSNHEMRAFLTALVKSHPLSKSTQHVNIFFKAIITGFLVDENLIVLSKCPNGPKENGGLFLIVIMRKVLLSLVNSYIFFSAIVCCFFGKKKPTLLDLLSNFIE